MYPIAHSLHFSQAAPAPSAHSDRSKQFLIQAQAKAMEIANKLKPTPRALLFMANPSPLAHLHFRTLETSST